MKQVSLLALTLASSGVLAIPAPNIFDPIASAISNTLKKWEGSNCDGDCRTGFGWDGRVMGNDPWGMPLNPGQPSGYVAPSSSADSSSSSAIANVAPIPTVTPKPATSAAPTLTVASVVPSSSSSSSAAPTSSSTEGVVKIFNAPPASSSAAQPQPSDGGFSVQAAPQPPADPQPAPPDNSQQQQAPPDNSQQQQAPPDNSQQQQPSPPDNSQQQQQPAAPAPPPATAPASPDVNDSDIQQYLNAHNNIRRQHGAADLTWSNDLEGFAKSWASGCVFEHSGGKFGRVGENLAAGTGDYTIQQAVKDWTDEVTSYNPSNPQPSHFTQVVWKETTQVGCSVVRCPGIFADIANYYVCEYLPAGNVIGHFAQQVQA